MNAATLASNSTANKPFDAWIAQAGTRTFALVAVVRLLLALAGVLKLMLVTKGFRILTVQSREPMMGLVVNASRTTLILIAASTMALGGSNIQTFFTDTMASGINGLVTGSNDKPEKVIDKNLVYTAVAMAAIDGAQGLNASNSADNVASAGRASLIAMLGVAGPPMTAAAMLLMYKVALALFIGFGPIFIMCLMFKVTEQMFWSWLKYGLGTLFSMAVLSSWSRSCWSRRCAWLEPCGRPVLSAACWTLQAARG
jgi:type IV secretion system protein VirB6